MGASGSRQNGFQETSSDGSTTPSTSTIPRKLEKSSIASKWKVYFKRKPTNRSRTLPFRELIKSWPISDLNLLLAEFEADSQLLKLQYECDLARKSIKTAGTEFRESFERFGDLEVDFNTLRLRINRQFFQQRCKNIQLPADNSLVFKLPTNFDSFKEHDIRVFLSEHIYCTDKEKEKKLPRGMRNEFGMNKKFAEDMAQMYRMDLKRGDLVITVISDNEDSVTDQKSKTTLFEIRCSSTIAAARSRLIRSLLSRKKEELSKTGDGTLDENYQKLSFSENIFHRPFAALFINFLYTDVIDWSLAPSSEFSVSSLSQAKAITSGKSPDVQLFRAMQILQVAKFFGVEGLIRACEDVIVKALTLDNVISVLQWSSENSSSYIKTQTFRLLEHQFHKITSTPSFFELSKSEMLHLVESHFLQSTELDMLKAVVRWGEHSLLKKLEEREPNVVADTCHSISRRGLKKTELSSEELREILAPLTERIRVDYALPPFHDSLTEAYSRGILTRSPLDLTVCQKTSEINPDLHWLKPVGAGPRYFVAYHKELVKWRSQKLADSSSGIKFKGIRRLHSQLEALSKSSPRSVRASGATSSRSFYPDDQDTSSGTQAEIFEATVLSSSAASPETPRIENREPTLYEIPSTSGQITDAQSNQNSSLAVFKPDLTPSDIPSTSGAIESGFHVEFQNLHPQLLNETLFLEAKRRILEIAEGWSISELTRDFHRNLALEMITRRVLVELDVSPECFDCHVSTGKPTIPDLLPPKASGIYDIF